MPHIAYQQHSCPVTRISITIISIEVTGNNHVTGIHEDTCNNKTCNMNGDPSDKIRETLHACVTVICKSRCSTCVHTTVWLVLLILLIYQSSRIIKQILLCFHDREYNNYKELPTTMFYYLNNQSLSLNMVKTEN